MNVCHVLHPSYQWWDSRKISCTSKRKYLGFFCFFPNYHLKSSVLVDMPQATILTVLLQDHLMCFVSTNKLDGHWWYHQNKNLVFFSDSSLLCVCYGTGGSRGLKICKYQNKGSSAQQSQTVLLPMFIKIQTPPLLNHQWNNDAHTSIVYLSCC